eukprot:m.477411 g.477411  ORF g.477411 m.477411 type:complete len:356 (-) comp20837_c1_seq1:197-1264(-)
MSTPEKQDPSLVNLAFLRSGDQFKQGQAGQDGEDTPKSARERLEDFYKSTLVAASDVVDRDVLHQPDYIERVRAARLRRQSDRDAGAGEEPRGALEQFFCDTVSAAHRASLGPDNASATELSSSPPSIVNLPFLRTGLEFKPDAPLSDTKVHPEDLPTHHERLEHFFVSTLTAAAKAAGARVPGSEGMPTPEQIRKIRHDHLASKQSDDAPKSETSTRSDAKSVVNVDFLRTGLEFKPAPLKHETKTGEVGEDEPKLTKHERLEQFYKATLAAAKKAAETPLPKEQRATSVVNLDFLRSGMEFESAPFAESKAKEAETRERSSTQSRLERFYQNTLKAASKVAEQGMLSTTPPQH